MNKKLVYENGELIYYEDDVPRHAGVIKYKGDIYYISSRGRAVKGRHVVHKSMANGILKHGTYKFADDYKLIKGSYVKPERIKQKKHISKSKMRLLGIVSGILCAALLIFAAIYNHISDVPPENAGKKGNGIEGKVRLPDFGEDILLMTEKAKAFIDGEIDLHQIANQKSQYRPMVFNYDLANQDGTLILREKAENRVIADYDLPSDTNVIEIHNLKTGTEYSYTVRRGTEVYMGTFKTAPGPRFLSVPGMMNARDIGGVYTMDGKYVKQGCLIRGTEIDGLVVPQYFVPTSEIAHVKEYFGFKYDMDLRHPSVAGGAYTSRLGSDVGHKFYGAPQYAQIFNPSYYASLRGIFKDLSRIENYPVYMHCSWGKDRTGTIVFLIQGILNVPLEDMITEYLLSALENPDISESMITDSVVSMLEPYEGDTVNQKIVSFLVKDVGVKEEEIEAIREIFLEDR